MATDVGTGTTLTFSGLDAQLELLSVEHSGFSTVSVDTTHMGTSTARTFIPGNLYDPGILTCEFNWEPAHDVPTIAIDTSGVVDYAGVGATDTWTFDGFLMDFTINSPLEDKMTATAVIKLTGAVAKA